LGQISLVSASLASVSISAFLYGVFLVLFCTSTYLMAQRERQARASSSRSLTIWKKPLFIGGIAYFITITANWILIVYRSFSAFIYYKDGTAPKEYYSLMVVPNVIKIAFWLSSLAVGDTMLLYRLWMTWSRNVYVIIFPLCTFIASIVCCVVVVYTEAHQVGQTTFDTAHIDPWLDSTWSLTMCTNLSCCVLIIWRLWRVHSQVMSLVEQSEKRGLKWFLSVFIESAVLCVFWTVLFIISYETYTSRNNLAFLVEDAWAPVSGIAFMLINIRVGLGYAMHTSVQRSSTDRLRLDPISFASLPITSTGHNVGSLDDELEVSDSLQLKRFKDGWASTAGIASAGLTLVHVVSKYK
ncbi:hypothetical protein BKA93DRAFT_775390, partial [Sparassis latifolia]